MENHIYLSRLGEKIRDLRKDMGRTQEEFAQDIGVSRLVVLKIEAGSANSSITRLRDIARALRVELKDLVTL
ncbi:helix-turn-helix transcriptional regulator [Fluviicola sp.]|uniref:helix-turn-helix transcriptional regulator n=1 Tax=Fluviicola sp. TaxID=1917219 RepID=UPI00261105A4|nr:helix-turn-helix transcriptional regulator [Fluviicola sp.]